MFTIGRQYRHKEILKPLDELFRIDVKLHLEAPHRKRIAKPGRICVEEANEGTQRSTDIDSVIAVSARWHVHDQAQGEYARRLVGGNVYTLLHLEHVRVRRHGPDEPSHRVRRRQGLTDLGRNEQSCERVGDGVNTGIGLRSTQGGYIPLLPVNIGSRVLNICGSWVSKTRLRAARYRARYSDCHVDNLYAIVVTKSSQRTKIEVRLFVARNP